MAQSYTAEFKKKIVGLHEEGRMYKSITAEYGVLKASVSKWYSDFSKECQTSPEQVLEKDGENPAGRGGHQSSPRSEREF